MMQCSRLTRFANCTYILLGVVFLVVPWVALMEVKRAFKPRRFPHLTTAVR